MPKPGNQRFVLRLWIPVLLLCAVLGALVIAALASGDAGRSLPVAVGLIVATLLILVTRWRQKRRITRMFQSADPSTVLQSFAASSHRIPHGSQLAAANAATILALYGRVEEAERYLANVSWHSVPPLIQAQESAARAVIAYVQGSVTEGLDHAVTGLQQASLNLAVPGAQISELAFRTHRNLGLALSGRTTETTSQELRTALTRLPLVGQILAAWGLALIAKNDNDAAQLRSMRQFITDRVPYLRPVLESTGAG